MSDIRIYPMRARVIRFPVNRTKYRFRFEKYGGDCFIELTDVTKAGAMRQLQERCDRPWDYKLTRQEELK